MPLVAPVNKCSNLLPDNIEIATSAHVALHVSFLAMTGKCEHISPTFIEQILNKFLLALLLVLFILPLPTAFAEEKLSSKLEAILHKYSDKSLALSLYDLSSGTKSFGSNEDAPLQAASVQKVLTSVVALRELGPEYRFSTDVFGEIDSVGHAPFIVVQGGGAPDLTTEDLWKIVRALKRRGLKRIGNLELNESHFEGVKERSGQRAYESASSALALNFNSLGIEICPTERGKAARVSIDPPEAAISVQGTITTKAGSQSEAQVDLVTTDNGDIVRVSGNIGASTHCSLTYRSVSDPTAYFERVLLGLLEKEGIKVEKSSKSVSSGWKKLGLLYSNDSKALRLILDDLNHFSTNFIAEQVLYALGESKAHTFDRADGLKKLQDYIKSLDFNDNCAQIFDASGLDAQNRMCAEGITRVLLDAYRDPSFDAEFIGSLSVAGRSGTLRHRPLSRDGLVLRGKTGSLDTVISLGGYLVSKSGRRYALAFIQNHVSSKDHAMEIEKEVVDAIYLLG